MSTHIHTQHCSSMAYYICETITRKLELAEE